MDDKYYLITYSENDGAPKNAAISNSPAEWLYNQLRWGSPDKMVILFSMEISQEDFDRVIRVLR